MLSGPDKCHGYPFLLDPYAVNVDCLCYRYKYPILIYTYIIIYEPSHVKTNNLGVRPGPTQTSLYTEAG